MLLPFQTDVPVRQTPWVNYVLIAVNVLVFAFAEMSRQSNAVNNALQLSTFTPHWYGFITYQFAHGGWFHLLGNMLFLWIFGNAVNSKMGNIVYAMFYLAGGIFAGIGFLLFSDGLVIGASGAIAAVTSAFVVLFPRSHVSVLYFFWTFQVPSLILVAIFVVWNNIITAGGDGIAYSAHLAGYLYGFIVPLALLWPRALPRDQFDLLALLDRHRRRAEWRNAMANPQNASQAQYGRVAADAPEEKPKPKARPTARPASGNVLPPLARPVNPVEPKDDAQLAEIEAMRLKISQSAREHEWDDVLSDYQKLLKLDDKQVMPERIQRDIANWYAHRREWPAAADAYLKLLSKYPKADRAYEIELLVGLVLSRHLNKDSEAEAWIKRAQPRLVREKDRNLADKLLKEIASRRGTPDSDLGNSAPVPG